MTEKSTMLNFIERIAEKRPEQITPKERGQIEKAIQKLSGNNPNIDLVCDLRAKLAEILRNLLKVTPALISGPLIYF